MIKTERMRDMNDPWVTEYRGQFNFAIPADQEVQSFIYDYDNNYYAYPHPSARLPNGKFNGTIKISNDQYIIYAY